MSFTFYFLLLIFLGDGINQLARNSNWSLTSQQEVSTMDELLETNDLGDYTPFKLGIEMRPVEENFNMNRTWYESLVHTIKKNIKIVELRYQSDGVVTRIVDSDKPKNNIHRFSERFENIYEGHMHE